MRPCALAGALLLLLAHAARALTYASGSIVPTSWRGQFVGQRTRPQPLLHRNCPVFGADKMVVVPLPKPDDISITTEDDYKLQLLIDDERFPTPWITVLGPRVDGIPMVEITVDFSGDVITRVKASLTKLPDKHHREHREIIAELQDASRWPKHVVVRYKWRDVAEVDAYAGLLFAFVAAIAVAGIAGWRAFGGYFEDFQELLDRAVVSEHGGGEGHEWHGGDGDRGGRSHGGATVYAPAQATGMKAD